jgi:hypothetical protein
VLQSSATPPSTSLIVQPFAERSPQHIPPLRERMGATGVDIETHESQVQTIRGAVAPPRIGCPVKTMSLPVATGDPQGANDPAVGQVIRGARCPQLDGPARVFILRFGCPVGDLSLRGVWALARGADVQLKSAAATGYVINEVQDRSGPAGG